MFDFSNIKNWIVVSNYFLHNTVGHNLGGVHPFYDEELVKVGQTGGIMDYGL